MKRSTPPQTIYKKQKLERDDVIDITDFDVVAWIKGEMRMMLDEEIARAILVGDGRDPSSDDKINPQCIRPIWQDSDVFTIKKAIELGANATADEKAKAFIRAAVKSRKDYKGSGNPVLFTTEDMLTDCLLMEDQMGRVIYDTVDKLATAMRVSRIVTVPVMENLSRTSGSYAYALGGIIVNLADYNVGADKGGAVNMFDDFDIDYNAQKYLIETRCSGALIKPYSAIALEFKSAASNQEQQMAKYCGQIGYAILEEIPAGSGVSVESIIERTYYGDVVRNTRRISANDKVNNDIEISNEFSIVSDPFAAQNFHSIRYITYMGSKWRVSSVDVQYPRLILTVGGLYNGQQT